MYSLIVGTMNVYLAIGQNLEWFNARIIHAQFEYACLPLDGWKLALNLPLSC